MQSDDLGLAAKPVLWRYRNHDINGDPWPWSYTEREPAPGSYAEIEPLCRAAAIERLVAERDEAREALKPFATFDGFNNWCPDDTPAWHDAPDDGDGNFEASAVTVGDFRRARQALGDT